jgi:hypothetical protein
MTPYEFLKQLWAEKPSDLYLLIWTLQDKRSRWFRSVEEAAAAVAQTPQDVYVGVGLSPKISAPTNVVLRNESPHRGSVGDWMCSPKRTPESSALLSQRPLRSSREMPPSSPFRRVTGAMCGWY